MYHNDIMYAVMRDRAAQLQDEARVHRLSRHGATSSRRYPGIRRKRHQT